MQASVPLFTNDHLDAGDRVDHHFGQRVLEGARGTETGAFLQGFLQSADDLRVRMAADGGPQPM